MIITQKIADFVPSDELVIWDVRDADKYEQGHIRYATNVPLTHINAEALNQTAGDVYVLCGGGTKAQKACELLERLDPNRTYIHLTGGTREAQALGWTLIQENP